MSNLAKARMWLAIAVIAIAVAAAAYFHLIPDFNLVGVIYPTPNPVSAKATEPMAEAPKSLTGAPAPRVFALDRAVFHSEGDLISVDMHSALWVTSQPSWSSISYAIQKLLPYWGVSAVTICPQKRQRELKGRQYTEIVITPFPAH